VHIVGTSHRPLPEEFLSSRGGTSKSFAGTGRHSNDTSKSFPIEIGSKIESAVVFCRLRSGSAVSCKPDEEDVAPARVVSSAASKLQFFPKDARIVCCRETSSLGSLMAGSNPTKC
jgi:hypothetical protein